MNDDVDYWREEEQIQLVRQVEGRESTAVIEAIQAIADQIKRLNRNLERIEEAIDEHFE